MTRTIIMLLPVIIFSACTESRNKTMNTGTVVVGCYSPKTGDSDWYTSGKKAPLFDGLSGVDFRLSRGSVEVQRYFNQGLMLSYGFNHAEAARSFYEAIRLDSASAMAYWGYAYVLGPNYNGGMEADNFQRAYEAMMKAQSLSNTASPVEKALISALSKRYVANPPADRSSLDQSYSAAMKKVYQEFPNDPDVGALYAESLMNLHPWDLYDKESKQPKPWTPEMIAVLEHLMKLNPLHPGAHHFYIHALEASSTPEKALASAALLDTLVPGAGHLVHMPSHIYINTGDYHAGSLSNLRAVKVDSVYTTACHAQGVYPLAYYPHNYHFLAATATLEGNSSLAWMAAKKLQQHTATEIMDQPGWGTLQHYYIIPYYIAVKFGMWDTILALPSPVKDLSYPRAIWHYARGMAYLAKKDRSNAAKEMTSLKALSADTTLKDLTVWSINTTADLVAIAVNLLSAEIASDENQYEKAITLLNEAVAIEDKLNYNEPPDWFFSIRHHLGATLLKAGRHGEAERVYKKDLQTWKKNGWALKGLHNSLVSQGKTRDADTIRSLFEQAWQYADTKIESSVIW